jgi:serine/threonine-protein kinase
VTQGEDPPRSVPAGGEVRASVLAHRVIAANARLNAIAAVTVIALIVLGAWVHHGIKTSLQQIRAAEMRTMLDAEVKALQLWVENRKTHVQHWAQDARVRRHVAALVALARENSASNEQLWNAPARLALAATLDSVLRGAGAVSFNVVDTGGRIVATQRHEISGRRINPGSFLGQLYDVFKGQTQFIRPHLDKDRVEGASASVPSRPVVWFEAPVADEGGRVIAALGFSYPAGGEFAGILGVARPGSTGEVYAFDEHGVMLSESRFVTELRRAGLVPEDAGAILRVQIRDPGGDVAAGHKPEVEWAALPLTRLAALAVASRGKAGTEGHQGVIAEPYRSYLGIEVVGAWRWLSEYDLGVAIEVGAAEAYAPLAYLNFAFALILSLIAAALAAVLWSAINVWRLRREVGEDRVIGQYQLETQIGEGGMAKIYLARHALLKRPVALKMLKRHLASDEIVARFEREVQLASTLSHPNVVEIYDDGHSAEGHFYYAMEYIEGINLGELIANAGALPVPRAVHILRQLCAGLAAAHDKGVLHRDLKPANVMIDGRGRVRLADFGLAGAMAAEGEGLAGTPTYMAPELFAGQPTTVQSDVYALGLVLYELFTGIRVWRADDLGQLRNLHATSTPDPPSTHARALDPRIDHAILSCLERNPARRPRSPSSVAAALTGSDPIAAALAAGETPTPEMVAASGGEGALSTTAACAAAVAILALFAALMYVAPRASAFGYLEIDDEPAVLAHRAREILEGLDLAVPDGDRASGLNLDLDLVAATPGSAAKSYMLLEAEFWYREAPFSLQPGDFAWGVSSDDPPLRWPGMVSLGLSTRGKLRWLEATPSIPPRQLSDPIRSGARCDWQPLFAAAGLVSAEFKPVESRRTPLQAFDERMAWTGPDPRDSQAELTVEGAALEGRPVSFRMYGREPTTPRFLELFSGSSTSARVVQFWMWLPALVGGIALAWRNLSRGRGDRRGAAALTSFIVVEALVVALLRMNHTTELLVEQWRLVQGLSYALYQGALVGVLYLALEPAVRRFWPDHLVSWSRLLSGRWRDPRVARDLLIGLGAGVLGAIIGLVQAWLGHLLHAPRRLLFEWNFPHSAGLRETIANLGQQVGEGVFAGLLVLFSLVVLRFLVRRGWIACVLLAPLTVVANDFSLTTGVPMLDWTARLLLAANFVFLVARFGFIALATGVATFYFLNMVPITNELGAWYADRTIFAGLVIGGLALVAARIATGRRAGYFPRTIAG